MEVALRRVGYKGTGFSFVFANCPTRQAFRDYVRKLPATVHEPWMSGKGETPTGFTVMDNHPVFPGTIPESDGSFLCDIAIVVLDTEFDREARRRWYHEIGHAVDFATKSGHRAASDIEFPAYCTEFLCEALDVFLDGAGGPIMSGFPHMFPWVDQPGEKA